MDKIAFIGGGNMASAMVGGIIGSGWDRSWITIVDRNAEKREHFASELGVHATSNMASAAVADTIVLAVKPQAIAAVANQMDFDLSGKLILSIAAGLTTAKLESLFGPVAIARAMPNTPAQLGLGATGLFVNGYATEAQFSASKAVVEAFGICITVKHEDLLDAVTAVSGSGPAYYFLMIEEMIRAGTSLGLSPEDAEVLTLQTALGAATMAAKGPATEALRAGVTSPKGTTHAAIISMQENGFGDVIARGMIACRDRAVELGEG